MHIGVDASRLLREQRGMGRYVRNLLRELPLADPGVHFTVYATGGSANAALRTLLQSIGETAGRSTLEDARLLPESRADVMWYPWNWVHPRARHTAIAVTIHDVVPMLQLDHRWWKVLKRAKYRRRYTATVHAADAIVADSAFTVEELQRVLHPDMSKVHEVLLASDDFVADGGDGARIADTLGITGPFFMAVGAHEARKNLPVLFSAMRELHRDGHSVPLVLCGPGARLSNAAGAERDSWLRYAGYVSDADLAALYRQATALVFPSRYEGFGLPVLEAMQCGGRVVCANASSLPQVAGDAALLFPPDDARALAIQLRRLLDDPALRETLAARGRVQAARFRWSETARQTLVAFNAAIDRAHERRGGTTGAGDSRAALRARG